MADPTPKASADEVREALAAATPGPWERNGCRVEAWHITDDGEYVQDMLIYDEGGHDEADAHLIANAPSWLGQLLSALEAEEAENERLAANAYYDAEELARANTTIVEMGKVIDSEQENGAMWADKFNIANADAERYREALERIAGMDPGAWYHPMSDIARQALQEQSGAGDD